MRNDGIVFVAPISTNIEDSDSPIQILGTSVPTALNSVVWEMFEDDMYFGLTAVRPVGDTDFNSPQLFHFPLRTQAVKFLEIISYATISRATV